MNIKNENEVTIYKIFKTYCIVDVKYHSESITLVSLTIHIYVRKIKLLKYVNEK